MTFLANWSEDPLHFLCFVLSILANAGVRSEFWQSRRKSMISSWSICLAGLELNGFVTKFLPMTFLANWSEDPLHFLCFVLSILANAGVRSEFWQSRRRSMISSWSICLAGLELNVLSRLNNSSSLLRFLGLALSWNPPLISCYTEATPHWIGSFPTDGSKTGFNSVRKAIGHWTLEWLHGNLPFYFHSAANMMIPGWSPNQFLSVTYLPHRLSRGFARYLLLVKLDILRNFERGFQKLL